MTAVSLPSFFNVIPHANGLEQISGGDTNMFRLAKEQGYETYFYSAQAENQMAILNLIGKKWIDHLIQPTQLGYGNGDNMPDEKLLPLFDKINLQQGQLFDLSKIPVFKQPAPSKIGQGSIQNIVLIMGESESAAHLKLFGYGRETSPFLTRLSQADFKPIVKPGILSCCTNAVRTPHTAHCCSLKIKYSAKPILRISTTTPSTKPTK